MTKYQFTDEHMRTVSTLSDNFIVQASRRAHWDEWMKAHDSSVIRNAIAHIDSTPAVTWTGPGGVKERLLEFIDG